MPDFRVNPLQLPEPIRATPLDFRPLGEIGAELEVHRKRQQIAGVLSSVTDARGNLDIDRAGTELAKIGLLDEARPILALAQQKAALAQNTAHQKAMEGIAQAAERRQAEQPMVIPYGAGVMRRSGEVIREPGGTGLLDEDTVTAMAHQLRAGDTSVLTNLGRGAQGAENIVRVRRKVAELNAAGGESGAEQAARQAEYFGTKAGERTLGNRAANIELAATEFKQVLPVVTEASKAVSRTNYPDLNRIIQAFNEKTGDPNVVAFGGGVNTLVNLYARAISPTGVPTVSDKDHAREILSRAWSQGQFDAAVGIMTKEIDAALQSPGAVRQHMRERFMQGQGTGAAPLTSPAVAPAAPQQPPTAPTTRGPDARAQQFLRDHPETRDAFDEKFGRGLSDRILGPRQQI